MKRRWRWGEQKTLGKMEKTMDAAFSNVDEMDRDVGFWIEEKRRGRLLDRRLLLLLLLLLHSK